MGRKARLKLTRESEPLPPANATAAPALTLAGRWSTREWIIIASLLILTFAVFGQVTSHAFLNLDDGQFIYENTHVLNGDIGWALKSAEVGWYPLTWLSHMVDVKLWGTNAGMHILTGVLLHAISAILLFLALQTMTTATWPSAFVAALFAVHPMHVESVVWASERKDTLSTLFAMLALLLYARAPRRMLGVAIALALSLAAKQMYITLPFVFLLLDIWPLRRLETFDDLRTRVTEKWPLFVLTIAGIAAALIGQGNLNAVQSTASLPIAERLTNALVAYATYLGKLFVPTGMAVPYPLTRLPLSSAILPLAILAAITIGVVAARRAAPWLMTGWFWFLGTLVPVIGIVAIGNQSMADRYTYFSYVGLFLILAFGAAELQRRFALPVAALAGAAVIAIGIYATLAFQQVQYWSDSETLFTHTLAVTRDNPVAEYTLGQALQSSKPDAAIPHLRRAIALTEPLLTQTNTRKPSWYPQAYVALGNGMLTKAGSLAPSPEREGLIRDAVASYQNALAIDPDAPHAKHNIEVATQMLPAQASAITGAPPVANPSGAATPPPPTSNSSSATAPAVAGQPAANVPLSDYDAYLNEGTALSQQGHYNEAIDEYRHAVTIAPRSAEARVYLALGLLQANRGFECLSELRAAKVIDAKLANQVLTKALHLPPSDSNLDGFMAQVSSP